MNFDRLKKFVFENYKMLIPVVLLLVIFLAFIVYYFVSRTFTFSKVEIGSYYHYFGDEKVSYEIEVTKDKRGVITNLKPVDKIINYDSTPIYDSKNDIVIFPQNMSVITPIVNCSEYLIKANSYIKYENKRYSLITKNYNEYLSHYFFYDGRDLYFFIEDVTLVVDKKEIELSPFSYLIADGNEVTYYDRVNDKVETVEVSVVDVHIKNDYYTVYVGNDYIDYYGQRVILTEDVTYLSTIDEMSRVTNK